MIDAERGPLVSCNLSPEVVIAMPMHRASLIPLSLCLSLAACPGGDDGDTGNTTVAADSTTGTPTPPDTTTGNPPATDDATTGDPPAGTSSSSGGSSSSGEPADSGTTMPEFIFDLGAIPEAPPIETECGKVDFMFIIDNSGSMGDEQALLVANFPAFINGIQNVLQDVETYQVGVITTDAYSYNIAGCNNLSSLVVQTGGANSSNMACGPYAEGYNFMTEMDDLAISFSCAAQVGTVGSATERPMQAMVEAVQKVDGGPGQCNEGYLRDDALLVIVVITDEPDNASVGDPMTWYDAVLTAKAGIPENVVVLSLINTPGGMCAGGEATTIAAFTQLWGVNGLMADICTPDYAPIFDQAIGLIDVACENYIPPD